MSNFGRLTQIGWLHGAPDDFRDALLGAAILRQYSPGTVFWQAGESGEGLIGIISGEASGLHAMARPDTPVIHILGPGFWAGDGPLLDGGPLAMTMVARTPVKAALVPRHAIMAILAERPHHWREIGRMAMGHAYLPIAMVADLMITDSRERCAATLLRLCGCRMGPPDGPAEVAVTQAELAAMASLSRASIGPIVKELVANGLVSIGYRKIKIINVPALRSIADGE